MSGIQAQRQQDKSITQITIGQDQTSRMMQTSSLESLRSTLANLSDTGISIHTIADIAGDRPTNEDFMAMQATMQQNLDIKIPADKFLLLRNEIERAGWSRMHLKNSLSWWLKCHHYPTWKVADFFDMPSARLYPRSWYLEQIHNDRSAGSRIESYLVAGTYLYRYADGSTLPFELVSKAKTNNGNSQ